jgi:AhpD family alkylhydroperoxidase
MQSRLDYRKASPAALKTMLDMEMYLASCGLERSLVLLIKMRASQLNGCAHCLDMHSKDARQQGETEQRLYLLNAWRETSLFSARERAALAWTEALTFVAETRVPDDVYEVAHAQFSDRELMDLTLAVAAINSWNRIAISFRVEAGNYQPLAALKAHG